MLALGCANSNAGRTLQLAAMLALVSLQIVVATGDERSQQPVAIHDLPGRPLHVRADVSTTLIPASTSVSVRGGNNQGLVKQYLVRAVFPLPDGIQEKLRDIAIGKFVQYIPDDSFVVMLNSAGVDAALAMEGVLGVYHMSKDMKKPSQEEQNNAANAAASSSNAAAQNQDKPSKSSEHAHDGSNKSHGKASDPTNNITLIDVAVAPGATQLATVHTWERELSRLIDGWCEIRMPSSGKVVVEVDGSVKALVIDWLADQEEVMWVEERPQITAFNKYSKGVIQDSTTDASSNFLWAKGLNGAGEVVGCADTGVDFDSCFFRDSSLSVSTCSGLGVVSNCINQNHRKVVTYRYFSWSDGKDTAGGHGTHVTGSILGAAGAGLATTTAITFATQYDGVARGAKLAFDDISTDGSSLWLPDDLSTQLFPHSAAAGARLHSNSWGSTSNAYTAMSQEMDQYMYENSDYLILVAAGNDGYASSTVGTPATAKNILAVGAADQTAAAYMDYYGVTRTEGSLRVIDFSSRGPTADGRMKPDVVCPGTYIRSANSDGVIGSNQCGAYVSSGTDYGGSVRSMSGTSMATPTCAGAAALVRQYYREGWLAAGVKDVTQGFTPSGALVKATMIHSGRKMSYKNSAGVMTDVGVLPHPSQGFGRVDLSTVLWFGATKALFVRDRQQISQGGSTQLCFDVRAATTFKVSLVWTDPPGVLQATKALIHDLDLRVITPSGTTLYGNSFTDASGAPTPDRLNNAEQLTFESPTAGIYTVIVDGYTVVSASQAYSLVVTGDATMSATCTAATPAPTTPAPTPAPTIASPTPAPTTPAPTRAPTPAPTTPAPTRAPTPAPTTPAPTRAPTPAPTTPAPTRAPTPAPTTPAPTIPATPSPTPAPTNPTPSPTPAPTTPSPTPAPTTPAPTAPATPSPTPAPTTPTPSPSPSPTPSPSPGTCSSYGGLATLSGTTLPSVSTSTTVPMRVRFVTDSSVVKQGFVAIYSPSNVLPVTSTCTNSGVILTDNAGYVSDGTGKYSSNSNCQWVIAPPNAASVTIKFLTFVTELNADFVRVDTCADAVCGTPISTQSFSGTTIPADITITTGFMRVRFTSNGSMNRDGFTAVYTAGTISPCVNPATASITTTTMGVISDGNGVYANSQACKWLLAPAGATGVRLEFVQFDVESGYDFVYVEQCSARRKTVTDGSVDIPSRRSNVHESDATSTVLEQAHALVKSALKVISSWWDNTIGK